MKIFENGKFQNQNNTLRRRIRSRKILYIVRIRQHADIVRLGDPPGVFRDVDTAVLRPNGPLEGGRNFRDAFPFGPCGLAAVSDGEDDVQGPRVHDAPHEGHNEVPALRLHPDHQLELERRPLHGGRPEEVLRADRGDRLPPGGGRERAAGVGVQRGPRAGGRDVPGADGEDPPAVHGGLLAGGGPAPEGGGDAGPDRHSDHGVDVRGAVPPVEAGAGAALHRQRVEHHPAGGQRAAAGVRAGEGAGAAADPGGALGGGEEPAEGAGVLRVAAGPAVHRDLPRVHQHDERPHQGDSEDAQPLRLQAHPVPGGREELPGGAEGQGRPELRHDREPRDAAVGAQQGAVRPVVHRQAQRDRGHGLRGEGHPGKGAAERARPDRDPRGAEEAAQDEHRLHQLLRARGLPAELQLHQREPGPPHLPRARRVQRDGQAQERPRAHLQGESRAEDRLHAQERGDRDHRGREGEQGRPRQRGRGGGGARGHLRRKGREPDPGRGEVPEGDGARLPQRAQRAAAGLPPHQGGRQVHHLLGVPHQGDGARGRVLRQRDQDLDLRHLPPDGVGGQLPAGRRRLLDLRAPQEERGDLPQPQARPGPQAAQGAPELLQG